MRGKSKHKAQMEIMGLAIVVILITLGILFAVTVMQKPESKLEQEFKAKTIATSYLDSLLGTNTACHKATFRELVQDCAQSAQIRCPEGNSCEFIQTEFQSIFDRTFGVRRTKVHLKFEGPGDISTVIVGDPCPGELTPGIQYIATRTGTVTARLDLCS